MLKTILVTGGAGFIGSHVVDRLVERNYNVIVVDNLSSGKKENLNHEAKFYKLDIQSPKLADVFKKERPEYVFHLAAQINVRKSIENPMEDAETNILGSLNLLENCKNFKVKKIIFSSSGGAIYGDTKIIPTPETTVPYPQSPYAIAKLGVEHYLDFYYKVYGLNYTILRYANVYGPRQNSHGEAGVIAIFTDRIKQNQQITINGNGKQTRDFIYVKNVVEANLIAITKGSNEIYNIGTGKETDINNLVSLISLSFHGNKLNRTLKIKYKPKVNGEIFRSCLDINKASRDGFLNNNISISNGLKDMLSERDV